MPVRTSDAEWHGTLREGRGHMRLGSGAYDGAYTFASRFEEGGGSNPEELVGAAFAGCFSMALSADLGRAGYTAELVRTTAKVHITPAEGGGFEISRIDLTTGAKVPGVDAAKFAEIAEGTKASCPVAKALKTVKVTLDATLE